MLLECHVPSDAEDDNESESDFVVEDEDIPESELDEPPQQPRQKQSRCNGWLGKDKNTWWQKKVPNTAVRTRAHNIFQGRSGRRGPALQAKLPFDFWDLFITPGMTEILVEQTNLIISNKGQKYTQKSKGRETDIVEMKTFLGLILLAGIYHSNIMNLDDLWNPDGTSIDVFRLTCHCIAFAFSSVV